MLYMFMFSPLDTDVFVVLQIYIYAYSVGDKSRWSTLQNNIYFQIDFITKMMGAP